MMTLRASSLRQRGGPTGRQRNYSNIRIFGTLKGVGAHASEQYLSELWAPGHAVLCAWKPKTRSFTHSKFHARLLSVRFFPEPFEGLKTTYVGGRPGTDTANRLSENHL
jgi:hypothetical protein